eukprot:11187440-Lingulodinium_polyedra.AAC.1
MRAETVEQKEKPRVRPIQVREWIRKVFTQRINNVEAEAATRKQLQARQWGAVGSRAEQRP